MEEYITCLYNLVNNCQYGDLKSETIRGWLVVRIRNSSLSDRALTNGRSTDAQEGKDMQPFVGEKQSKSTSYVKEKPHRRHGGTPH